MKLLVRSILVILILTFTACAFKQSGPHAVEGGVLFTVRAPSAKSVSITGSFNHWDASTDRLSGPDERGIWRIVLPLPAGRHEYLFVVNGEEWLPDPSAPSIDDGLGGRNSFISVDK